MALRHLILLAVLLVLSFTTVADKAVSRVAFGSCLHQWKPQPVWEAIMARNPDLFLFLGDNVYADTTDMAQMRSVYAQLAAQPGYQRLQAQCPVLATWDDHDYGANDAGRDYPMREQSRQIFLDFFRVPATAPSRRRPGVYSAHTYGPPGQRLQIILLDTRYFRSPLKRAARTKDCPAVNFAPNTDPGATILGEEQWLWLGEQLRRPARLRIIASSIQVIPDQHCFEKWANFPNELTRLFRTIRDSGASGILLVSGDRHLAEISRLESPELDYPLYEITSSGMNSARAGQGERNRHRLGRDNFREDNFGVVAIDWEAAPSPLVRLQVLDTRGGVALSQQLSLDHISSASIKRQ